MRNSISVSALSEYVNEVKEFRAEGIAKYGVEVDWQTGTRAIAKALPMEIGPHVVSRDFQWIIDEPRQLLGTNQAPNPQEYLLSGVGACLMVAFTVGASMKEIQLESLKVTVSGELDLAGFLEIDESAPIGFKNINYLFEVKSDAHTDELELLRQKAQAHSPNAMTVMLGADISGKLIVKN